jgi:hypothetical protein
LLPVEWRGALCFIVIVDREWPLMLTLTPHTLVLNYTGIIAAALAVYAQAKEILRRPTSIDLDTAGRAINVTCVSDPPNPRYPIYSLHYLGYIVNLPRFVFSSSRWGQLAQLLHTEGVV